LNFSSNSLSYSNFSVPFPLQFLSFRLNFNKRMVFFLNRDYGPNLITLVCESAEARESRLINITPDVGNLATRFPCDLSDRHNCVRDFPDFTGSMACFSN
jgi:hypothetical protein